ncbi:MAG: isochorismatase family protein, partial [Nitrososphaeria archaeon]|nr:isochorismatase family protein [Nitrososphaeria archaeon]
CVFFTAAEASMRGYEVVICSDSVAAISENDQQFALDQMGRVLKIRVEE